MRSWLHLSLALLSVAASAHADEGRLVQGAQVHLSDLVGELPTELPDLDIGAAPPPGSSRTIAKSEIVAAASKSGVSLKQLKLPTAIRVTSAAKRWSTEELASAATPLLLGSLPVGVNIKNARATSKVVTSPSAKITAVRVPRLPRREGEYLTTATIELTNEGQIVARIPLSLSLDISGSAALPAVGKGSRVQLIIESGPARISASAVALSDGEVGDTLQFRVASTMKILYGKVVDPTSARVVQ
ncbi:MAG TPA: flagella basal body P-ring formation protein FlgA [Polyangiaceae bacterium]|nr:flagella basal body P-ring formation protein FlgA [Polyangiaceae bacterium]